MAKQKVEITIEPKSVLVTIGILLLVYFLFVIKDILGIIFISFIFSSALSPVIKALEKKKISHGLSVAIVYILSTILFILLFSLISVPLAKEISKLLSSLPEVLQSILEDINSFLSRFTSEEVLSTDIITTNVENWSQSITQNLGNILSASANGILSITEIITKIFGGLMTFVSIFIISIYMSLDKDHFYDEIIIKITDRNQAKKVREFINKVESTLGNWLIGQAILSCVIGILAVIAYSIIQVPYVGSLALLTAILNIIPNLGPIIALIPLFIISLSTGNPLTIIGSVVSMITIQQLESQIVAPKVLSTAVGLPPIFIILSILIGAQLFGVAGVLLAVPIAVIVHLSLDFFSDN